MMKIFTIMIPKEKSSFFFFFGGGGGGVGVGIGINGDDVVSCGCSLVLNHLPLHAQLCEPVEE